LGAALEVLGYLAVVAAAALGFLMGWLSADGAAVVTLLLLLSLIGLAWKRFDGGRHPCFFFLCMLTLFQAGRLLAYCAGGVPPDIFRITLLTSYPFDVSRPVAALVLLSLALSAICIYAPCRWNYRFSCPPAGGPFDRFLPYLYLLFWLSVPVQLYKNYCYYQYAGEHGGYLALFLDRGGLVSSIPLPIRAISLISLPAFVGVFVLDERRKFLRLATAVYFTITAPILLLGSRGAIFGLILSLWYVAKIKSGRRARLYALGLLGAGLVLAGSLIGSFRILNDQSEALAGPSEFIAGLGNSLNVTEIAVAYRWRFAPYVVPYLAGELQAAFFPADQMKYVAGKHFSDDVSMFLNPAAYQIGYGGGSSYVAEAYLLGGLWGVLIVSGLLGALLHRMHLQARNRFGLFLVALILPDVLFMARGDLLAWVSTTLRVAISVLLLQAGWYLYQVLGRIGGVLWRGGDAFDHRVRRRRRQELAIQELLGEHP